MARRDPRSVGRTAIRSQQLVPSHAARPAAAAVALGLDATFLESYAGRHVGWPEETRCNPLSFSAVRVAGASEPGSGEIGPLQVRKRLSLVMIPMLLTAACAGNGATSQADGSPDGDLSGEVFIVTSEGTRVRLGHVEVRLIPEEAVAPALAQFRTDSQQGKRHLESKITEAQEAVSAAIRDVTSAEEKEKLLAAAHKADPSSMSSYKAWKDAQLAKVAAEKDRDHKQFALSKLKGASAEFEGSEFLIKTLRSTEGALMTKTDADGHFTIRIPRRRRFALAASGSRLGGQHEEKYHWFIWVSLKGRATEHVRLSNDNQTTALANESIVMLSR